MVQHEFAVQTNWSGGRESVGDLKGDVLSEQYQYPQDLVVMEQAQTQMSY